MRDLLMKTRDFLFSQNLVLVALCSVVCSMGCEPGVMIDPEDVGELIEDGGGDCDRDNDGVRAIVCGGEDCDEDNPQIGACEVCESSIDCGQNQLCSEEQYCLSLEQVYLKASNAEGSRGGPIAFGDGFGWSVSVSGNILAIGAFMEDGDANSTARNPNNNIPNAGAVYVFERQANGNWVQTAYLKAHNAEEMDRFGWSVALSGNLLAVGALGESGDARSLPQISNNNAENAGAVYVYELRNGQWLSTAYLKAHNAEEGDLFGTSIAIDGNRLIVGADEEDGDRRSSMQNSNNNAENAGAVYVFELWNGSWEQTAYLKSQKADVLDEFGYNMKTFDDFAKHVALSGNRIVVGAGGDLGDVRSTLENPNTNAENAGAAYIFELQNNGQWEQTAYLRAANVDERDRFGSAVSISGNLIAIGASGEDGDAGSTMQNTNNNAGSAGAAYIFELQNQRWRQTAYLKAFNAEEGDSFGRAVSIKGDRLIVGSSEDGDVRSTMRNPNNNTLRAGATYLFERRNDRWEQTAYLKAFNADEGDGFAGDNNIVISESHILVGATVEAGDINSTFENPNNNDRQAGAAYLYAIEE